MLYNKACRPFLGLGNLFHGLEEVPTHVRVGGLLAAGIEPSAILQAEIGVTKHIGGFEATSELLSLCHIESAREVLNVGCGIGVGSTYIAATTWRDVRNQPDKNNIRITGSAKKRIVSDLVRWNCSYLIRAADLQDGYRKITDGKNNRPACSDRS